MPEVSREHDETAAGAVLELVPDGKTLTSDNRKLGAR